MMRSVHYFSEIRMMHPGRLPVVFIHIHRSGVFLGIWSTFLGGSVTYFLPYWCTLSSRLTWSTRRKCFWFPAFTTQCIVYSCTRWTLSSLVVRLLPPGLGNGWSYRCCVQGTRVRGARRSVACTAPGFVLFIGPLVTFECFRWRGCLQRDAWLTL